MNSISFLETLSTYFTFFILMELLDKRDCMQAAEEYYHLLCQELNLEELTPHPRTQRTMRNIRAGQHISPFSTEDEIYAPFSPVIPQGIIEIPSSSQKNNYGTKNRKR